MIINKEQQSHLPVLVGFNVTHNMFIFMLVIMYIMISELRFWT